MKKLFFFIGLATFLTIGCNNSDDQKETDDEIIQGYITDNNLDAEMDEGDDGLYYIITEVGGLADEHPTQNSTVRVKYTGYLLDGTVFDSNTNFDGIQFGLNQVIRGWQIGIPKLTKGGKGTLLIPSHLGYGSQGSGSTIPGNTVLAFDVELIDYQ